VSASPLRRYLYTSDFLYLDDPNLNENVKKMYRDTLRWMDATDQLSQVVTDAKSSSTNPLMAVQMTGPSKQHAWSALKSRQEFAAFFSAYQDMDAETVPSMYIQRYLQEHLADQMADMEQVTSSR